MAELNFVIPGLDDLIRELNTIVVDLVPTVIAPAIYEGAQAIMTVSKRDWVPVDTGTLRSTGNVEPPQINGDAVTVQLGFGGPAAPYALIVHENLGAHHPVGAAKYLETPIQNSLGNSLPISGEAGMNLVDFLGKRIERRLKKLGGLS